MQPELSLSYSSGAGDGSLGMGWSVGGAGSVITRCGSTLDTDGKTSGVHFDAGDRFCLDGQKLINTGIIVPTTQGPLPSGEYGADQTQYRTESDGFAQIVSEA